MPLYLALLLSLSLHTLLIIAPGWPANRLHAFPQARFDARLIPQAPAKTPVDSVSTEASEAARGLPPPATPPRELRGSALRRAQASLTNHLYYPPEAIKRGLEGEVILLLQTARDGRVVSASIARSSGHVLLDQAALEAARRLGALPGSPRQTLFPVNFRLE